MDADRSRILALAEPVVASLGLELLEIEVAGAAERRLIRVYLDRSDGARGVTVDDCENASRRLGDVFDANETDVGDYMLEVSSPGLNRPLRKSEHFARVVGQRIKVRSRTEHEGRRNFTGRLVSFDGNVVGLSCDDGRTAAIALADVEKANLEYEFETPSRPGRRPSRSR